ncbi:hypothetical protein HDK77DRAFT_440374 [Phyllosticta capitalensis]
MIPIDVLSLTANIIAVVDFGITVTKEVKEQYRSADGLLKEDLESLKVLHDLRIVQETSKSKLSSKPNLTGEENDLLRMASLCDEIAGSLESELESLVVPKNAKYRRARVIKQRLRAISKKGDILEIEARLRKVQQGLDTRLASMIKDNTSSLMTNLEAMASRSESLHANISKQLLSTKDELVGAINAQKIDYTRIAELFERLKSEDKDAEKALDMLKRLRYVDYSNRYHDITEAHQRTFQWIFDNPEHQFTHWLEQQSGIYWITGKPGSGKSTLIKFIEEHDETREKLRTWANQQDLIVAQHYFWISGSKMQRSLEGFLRSIVFQILRKYPYLIPKTFPQHWTDREERELGEFSLRTLKDGLSRIAHDGDRPKMCLFIDGLDEFEGDQNEILQILKELDASPSVKLCSSSRSWEKFEHAFREKPRCLVHELTEEDIRKYARENIEKSPELMALIEDKRNFEEIVDEITFKAEGVFLWVFLVVRMLLDGPEEGASFGDLQKKLDSYPTELDDLYHRIYQSIKPEFRVDTARMLKMCLETIYELSTLMPFYLMDRQEDLDYVFSDNFHYLTTSEVRELYSSLSKRITARCKDFLQIHCPEPGSSIEGREIFYYNVGFMHRTARDYVEERLMPEHLEKELGNNFDARSMVAHGEFLAMKQTDLSRMAWEDDELKTTFYLSMVFPFFHRLERYEARWRRPLTRVIDELNCLLSTAAQAQNENWVHSYLCFFSEHAVVDVLDVAFCFGLFYYINAKLDVLQSQGEALNRRLLLLLARPGNYWLTDPLKLVGKLLRLGADMNHEVPADGRTIWEILLNSFYCGNYNQHPRNILSSTAIEVRVRNLMIEMLEHGANPDVIVHPHAEFTPMKRENILEQDRGPEGPPSPMTFEQLVHHVLPIEKDQVLQVLQQKRAEKAKLRSTSRTNTDPESTPTASRIN